MKSLIKFFILVFFGIGAESVSAQTAMPNITSEPITYHKEIPDSLTYKITKNTTGFPVATSILEEINLHRRFDVDYTWVVSPAIEILIYYVNKPKIINIGNGVK